MGTEEHIACTDAALGSDDAGGSAPLAEPPDVALLPALALPEAPLPAAVTPDAPLVSPLVGLGTTSGLTAPVAAAPLPSIEPSAVATAPLPALPEPAPR